MRKLEPSEVLKALASCGGDADKLAAALGVSKSHAYYLLRNKQGAAVAIQAPAVQPAAAPAQEPPISASEPQQEIHVLRTRVDFSAFIPPIDKQYKLRDVDEDITKYAERKDFATVLVGEAGSGKTYAAQQYAARHGLPFLRVACDDSLALRELLGRREIKGGTTFFKFGLLLEFLQVPSVILFDEFNALPGGKLFFLHEILDKMSDGHRVFVKEADTVISLNKDLRIFLACNPSTAKYSGTNKLNVALADRPRIINFQAFTVGEIKEFFDCGNEQTTAALKAYFAEARKLINQSSMRAVFSLRSVKRIAESLRQGDTIEKALEHNFYNMTLLTASETEREQLIALAKVCFGLDAFKKVSA